VAVKLPELVGECLAIVVCESNVGALEWLAGCEIGCGVFSVAVELAAAEGFVGVVDAGDEVAKVEARGVASTLSVKRGGFASVTPYDGSTTGLATVSHRPVSGRSGRSGGSSCGQR
jgi:hypothetical protein